MISRLKGEHITLRRRSRGMFQDADTRSRQEQGDTQGGRATQNPHTRGGLPQDKIYFKCTLLFLLRRRDVLRFFEPPLRLFDPLRDFFLLALRRERRRLPPFFEALRLERRRAFAIVLTMLPSANVQGVEWCKKPKMHRGGVATSATRGRLSPALYLPVSKTSKR